MGNGMDEREVSAPIINSAAFVEPSKLEEGVSREKISQTGSGDDVKKCYTLCKILKSFWQRNRYKIILLLIFLLLFGYNTRENLSFDSKLEQLQTYMQFLGSVRVGDSGGGGTAMS